MVAATMNNYLMFMRLLKCESGRFLVVVVGSCLLLGCFVVGGVCVCVIFLWGGGAPIFLRFPFI